MRRLALLSISSLAACASAASAPRGAQATAPAAGTATVAASAASAEDEVYGPRELSRDAAALQPILRTPLARAFAAQAVTLPAITPRRVWRAADRSRWYRDDEVAALPERAQLEPITVDETYFYAARFGSPLAYARAMEVLGEHGVDGLQGRRVLDIGAGGIASARLMAALGATVVAYDVDRSLPVIYGEPGDQGEVRGTSGAVGRARLAVGPTPFAVPLPEAPFDLIVSKNTLKRGYVHPARPADPKLLVDLGVSDTEYLRGLFELLAPGGLLLIYNITPPEAPLDQPYQPWADGRSPWTVGEWDAAGFDVVAFDRVDDAPMRAMGRALRWEAVDTDYFALFTLVRRR